MGALEHVEVSDIPGMAGGTPSSPPPSQEAMDAEDRALRAAIKKTTEAQRAKRKQIEVNESLPRGNTQGQIRYIEPPGDTPEKRSRLELSKEKVKKDLEKNVKSVKEGAKDVLGTNKGTDKLGGGAAANAAIDDGARLGGVKIKAGGEASVSIPSVNQSKDFKKNKEWTLGEPCVAEDGEDGIGGNVFSKLLSKLKFEKKGEKRGVEVMGKVGFSVSGDPVCVKTEKVGKGAIGVVVHKVENMPAAQNLDLNETFKRRSRLQDGAAD